MRFAQSTEDKMKKKAIDALKERKMSASELATILSEKCNVRLNGRRGRGIYNLLYDLMEEGIVERDRKKYSVYSLKEQIAYK